jgi:hypothetical protein
LHRGTARSQASPGGDVDFGVGRDGGAAVILLEALGDDDLRSDPNVHPAPALEGDLLHRQCVWVDRCDDHSLRSPIGEADGDDLEFEGGFRRDDRDDARVERR